VHAKTGTLNKVTALSGCVFGPDQQTGVSFSILVTGTSDHAGARQRMDAKPTRPQDSGSEPVSARGSALRHVASAVAESQGSMLLEQLALRGSGGGLSASDDGDVRPPIR
jgi:hypothetical protein